jgi:hypothetical protein
MKKMIFFVLAIAVLNQVTIFLCHPDDYLAVYK